jgi:hypothetical protein
MALLGLKAITLTFAVLLFTFIHIEWSTRRHSLILSLISFLLISQIIFGQNGGQSVFQVLNLAPSARSLALGGKYISVLDSDIVLAQFNPAMISQAGSKQVGISQSFYYSGSSCSDIGIGYYLNKQHITISGGLQYLQHGDIQATDEFGNKTGTFRAGEFALIAGASKKLFDPLTIGINVKYISSQIEGYGSSGLGIDLGALYTLRSGFKSIGLSVRNIGTQWNPYQDTKESLPFDVLLGFTQRLEHVPFILTVTSHSLNHWNLRYDNPQQEVSILGEPISGPSGLSKSIDNLARHLIFSAEVLLGKYAPLRLRMSYNHQRHQELKDQSYGGLSGFAGGFGIRLSKLSFDYGMANYHLAGSIHSIGIGYRWR